MFANSKKYSSTFKACYLHLKYPYLHSAYLVGVCKQWAVASLHMQGEIFCRKGKILFWVFLGYSGAEFRIYLYWGKTEIQQILRNTFGVQGVQLHTHFLALSLSNDQVLSIKIGFGAILKPRGQNFGFFDSPSPLMNRCGFLADPPSMCVPIHRKA